MNEEQKKIADNLIKLIIERLRLDIEPEDFSYDLELFGEELELDSVDAMEIIAIIDNEYGISMVGEYKKYFENINELSTYILKELNDKKE